MSDSLSTPTSSINWGSVTLTPQQTETLEKAREQALGSVSGFEGFGSFHSDNVEDLVRLPPSQYRKPVYLQPFAERILTNAELTRVYGLPSPAPALGEKRGRPSDDEDAVDYGAALPPLDEVELQRIASTPIAPCPFGAEFRARYFTVSRAMTFINHGAFGSAVSGAVAIKQRFEHVLEREVVEFVDRALLPLVVHSTRRLSEFVRADPTQIIVLQNATYALNSAMRLLEGDDVVAFLDTEYLAVYKMLWFRCKEVGAQLHEVPVSHLLHDTEIMGDDERLTEEICRKLPAKCSAVVIDYVTSSGALCFPIFSHIVPALRRRGVRKIIVDGAHAPLQVDLDFNSLPPEAQPTIFAGNLHKWFSAPKAAGFFWVRSEDAAAVHSVVLSHGAGDGLLSEFIWDGTRDYGAYLTIPALVDFWEAQGVARVRAACSALLEQAVDMLTAAFKSRKVARHAPFMSLVELPAELQEEAITAKYIQDVLHDVYRIEVPAKRVEGRNYLRISAFVYNTPADYAYLRDAVLSVAARWWSSEERRRQLEMLQSAAAAGNDSAAAGVSTEAVPCDERIRRQGGCGVSGLDPTKKPKKTSKFV